MEFQSSPPCKRVGYGHGCIDMVDKDKFNKGKEFAKKLAMSTDECTSKDEVEEELDSLAEELSGENVQRAVSEADDSEEKAWSDEQFYFIEKYDFQFTVDAEKELFEEMCNQIIFDITDPVHESSTDNLSNMVVGLVEENRCGYMERRVYDACKWELEEEGYDV